MYSTLLSIDLVTTKDGATAYVQTDHREADEIAATPELSTLFALTRVLGAKAYAASKGGGDVVYTCLADDVPGFLREALAAAGAVLEVALARVSLPKVDTTPAALADRALAALTARVYQRTGVTDAAAALKVVEAETLAAPPDREQDEHAYWARVLELAALTGELIRGRQGGRWVESDRADVPFGFELPGGELVLPTNRAARFIADGAGESMFLLVASMVEREAPDAPKGPVLPSLRARGEVVREGLIFRPVLAGLDDDDAPVIAYGTDSPTAFALLMTSRPDDRDQVHATAIANLAQQQAEVEILDRNGMKLAVVSNSFFATEKLLEVAFMQQLHKRLGQPMLAVAVPRRGLMFATSAADPRAVQLLAALIEKETGTSRKISSAILLVTKGAVVGRARLEGASEGDDGGDDDGGDDDVPAPPKKPGWLKRVLGRN